MSFSDKIQSVARDSGFRPYNAHSFALRVPVRNGMSSGRDVSVLVSAKRIAVYSGDVFGPDPGTIRKSWQIGQVDLMKVKQELHDAFASKHVDKILAMFWALYTDESKIKMPPEAIRFAEQRLLQQSDDGLIYGEYRTKSFGQHPQFVAVDPRGVFIYENTPEDMFGFSQMTPTCRWFAECGGNMEKMEKMVKELFAEAAVEEILGLVDLVLPGVRMGSDSRKDMINACFVPVTQTVGAWF